MDTQQSGNGTIISILVIVLILVVGAYYMWKNEQQVPLETEENLIENQLASPEELDQQAQAYQAQSSSDEMNSIEADLNATTFADI